MRMCGTFFFNALFCIGTGRERRVLNCKESPSVGMTFVGGGKGLWKGQSIWNL